jgi:hypothetical protein
LRRHSGWNSIHLPSRGGDRERGKLARSALTHKLSDFWMVGISCVAAHAVNFVAFGFHWSLPALVTLKMRGRSPSILVRCFTTWWKGKRERSLILPNRASGYT